MTLALTTRTGLTWIVPHHPHGVGVGLKPSLPPCSCGFETAPNAPRRSVSFCLVRLSFCLAGLSFCLLRVRHLSRKPKLNETK